MPGLMVAATSTARPSRSRRPRHRGSLHMTDPDRRADRDAQALGADVRWCSCNIFSTQDHAAAAIAKPAPPRLRLEGRDARGVLVVHLTGAHLAATARGPDLIVDDGGDATLLIHEGYEVEKARQGRQSPDPVDGQRRVPCVLDSRQDSPRTRRAGPRWSRTASASPRRPPPACTASTRWPRRAAALPRDQRQRLASPSRKFDNVYGCRHSLPTASCAPPTSCSRQESRHLRLRRRRQGLRPVDGPGRRVSSPRSTRSARSRPRMEGYEVARSTTSSARRTSSSPPPATRTSSPPTTCPR